MANDICDTIKVAMAEVEKRMNDGPTAAEELALGAEMARLEALWNINECGGGVDWGGLSIDPPTDEQINRVNELMQEAGQTTVAAMETDAIAGAVITVVAAAGGTTTT